MNEIIYHVISGAGDPLMTQESVTVSFKPTFILFSGSNIIGGSISDGFEIFRYCVSKDGSLRPILLTAVTRKVYSLLVVNFVTV